MTDFQGLGIRGLKQKLSGSEGLCNRRAKDIRHHDVGRPAQVHGCPGEVDLRDDQEKDADILALPLGAEELFHLGSHFKFGAIPIPKSGNLILV